MLASTIVPGHHMYY